MTMIVGSQTGSLMNHIMSGAKVEEPQVGMGATILCWTDRHAGTIIEVTGKQFIMQNDKAIRTDSNGMSDNQAYRYEPNPAGVLTTFRQVTRGRAKGQWRERGVTTSSRVLIGHRQAYYDFSF